MQFPVESAEYELREHIVGVFDVFPKETRQVRTVRMDSTGQHEVPPDEAAVKLAAALDKHPYFRFAFAGDGQYHVDLDCGFQRWIGTQSSRAMGHALRVCGFNARPILAEARKHETWYMGRVA